MAGGLVMINHYWRKRATGELYAVQETFQGTIRAVCGPLPQTDITLENLHRFRFSVLADPALVEQITGARDAYECQEPGMLHYQES
jgi:hypothetical protein